MKHLPLILLCPTLVAIVGWWLGSSRDIAITRHEVPVPRASPPPTSTITDPAVVFQKAFWKRPVPEDQILQAERREWQDTTGLSKWQWFISVKPSAPLVDHLVRDNAFGLSTSHDSRFDTTAAAPSWFPTKTTPGTQILTSGNGTFTLLWDKENNHLHATDSGTGFRPGAPEPGQPVASARPVGRLPPTPPPKP